MYPSRTQNHGFTIVELLIVVVVIAILAAITVVAYAGIQNRTNESAVQSDLANIAKKYELYKIDNGAYPYGGTLNVGTAFKLNISKNAYDQTQSYQLLNCTNTTNPGTDYAIVATSKNGKRFYVASNSGGVRAYTGADSWLNINTCGFVLTASSGNGAGYDSTNGWRGWTSAE